MFKTTLEVWMRSSGMGGLFHIYRPHYRPLVVPAPLQNGGTVCEGEEAIVHIPQGRWQSKKPIYICPLEHPIDFPREYPRD